MKKFFISRMNVTLSIFLLLAITFSIISVVFAATPNPGHDFTSIGGGAAQGDLIYGSAADTFSALAKNTSATRYLSNTGTSNNPAWAQIELTNGVTGILPSGNGGSANAFFTVSGPATSIKTFTFPNANATVLTDNAAVTAAQGGTGQAGGYTIGDILYASGASTLSKLAGVAAGSYLRSGGVGTAPVWSTPTLPNTASSLKLMVGNGTNWVESTPAYPNASVTAGKVIVSDGTNYIASTPTFPNVSATTRKIIVSDGTNWTASTETYAVPGTSGNLLMSDGTNWTSSAGGVLIGRQTLTSGTTYTPTSGTTKILIRLWGGGGGGGGCSAVAGCAGGGGGSGGYAEYYLTGVTGTYTYAVGASGAGNSGAAGSAGGNTTFNTGATTITAFGGSGGAFTAGTAAIKFMLGGAGGVISTNGHVNGAGFPGDPGMTSTVNTVVMSGNGGSTSLGGGGLSKNATAAGNAAIANTGSGGGGAAAVAGTANAGGAGAAGIIIITEFK